jgi:hypothetical protein
MPPLVTYQSINDMTKAIHKVKVKTTSSAFVISIRKKVQSLNLKLISFSQQVILVSSH